jgi:protein MpaA
MRSTKLSGTINHTRCIYGKSRLGAPLEVFGRFDPPVKYLLLAGQHGTEPEGTQLLSSTLRALPCRALRCAVAPCINPDGLVRGTRGNAAGVDLNRNFPAANWSPEKIYYHWNDEPDKEVALSPGRRAASEPETKALIDLIVRIKPVHIITIHAPFGWIDDPMASPLAHHLAHVCGLPLVRDTGYLTPGSLGSWAREKKLPLITFELPLDTIQHIRLRFGPLFVQLMKDEVLR